MSQPVPVAQSVPARDPALVTPSPAPIVGTIIVRGIRARCIIGERAWERRRRQRVLVDLAVEADLGPAARLDDLAQALDYKTLKDRVRGHVAASQHRMLEALASGIADLVLEDPRALGVEVTVEKPGALSGAKTVAVQLRRRRQ